MSIHLETMLRQHDELRALADEYDRQLARPEPDLAALANCRWTLARLLSSHLAYEGAHLFPTLNSGSESARQVARRMSAAVVGLGEHLQNHVREWTPAAIADDWAGYCRTSSKMLGLLRDHMAAEEVDLYPLLLIAKAA